jgi:Cu(I)/Ag(I) efflux system membrane fusion protein
VSHTIDFGGSEAGADLATPDTTLPSFVLSVEGNCDMCKTRIDAAASGVALVRYASWDPDGKLLTVYYKGARPSNDAVETAVAAVGHDTEHHRAPDEVYEKLPECCLYRK